MVLKEVMIEIEAQYQRFVELTGRQPQYFEGHAVASPNFMKGVELIAAEHGLKYSGISFDEKPIVVNGKKVYISMDSMGPDYDPFKKPEKTDRTSHMRTAST